MKNQWKYLYLKTQVIEFNWYRYISIYQWAVVKCICNAELFYYISYFIYLNFLENSFKLFIFF
jgi:hypothetical protein